MTPGLDITKYLLVFIIFIIVCWSYYAYVIEMCIIWSNNIVQKVFYIIIYHSILGIFAYSYFKAVVSHPPPIPLEFYLDSDEHAIAIEIFSERDKWRKYLEELVVKKNLRIYTRDVGSNIRFCSICQLIKPDRAHHCSSCGRCLLRMDHHCPWVGNCVGIHNHKFFILLLGYGALFCLFIGATTLEFAISWWQDSQVKNMRGVNFLILFVIACMFFFVQISLFFYHIYLTMNNLTTLESMRKSVFQDPDIISFNLGIFDNLKELLGDNVLCWFLPVYSSRGDGIVYPVRRKPIDYHSLEDH